MLNYTILRLRGRKLYYFVFILLIIQQTYSQEKGARQSFSSFGLSDVCFIDANTGWAVGEGGTILKTTDAGNNWFAQLSGNNSSLCGIHFTDLNNGTAVGTDFTGNNSDPFMGVILRTTDSGNKWILQSSGVPCILNEVFFINEKNGTIVGGGTDWGGVFGTILKTTDGGEHWMRQLYDTTTISFKGVYFTNMNTGTVLGNTFPNNGGSKILKTTDGGKNWLTQHSNVDCGNEAICFIDSNTGWVAGGNTILKTTDGGKNWFNQLKITSVNGLNDVCFTDENNGMAVGSEEIFDTGRLEIVIFRTTDGGKNWDKKQSGVKGWFCKLSLVDKNIGTIVGTGPMGGIILRTSNGGENWINQTYNITFVEEENVSKMTRDFFLYQNYPNPFNPTTTLSFFIGSRLALSFVTLKIYDILGREIATLVNEEKPSGTYEVIWKTADLPSGFYLYRLKAGNFTSTKKMILLK